MEPVQVILVGGFLSSGKTALLSRLARHYAKHCVSLHVWCRFRVVTALQMLVSRKATLHACSGDAMGLISAVF